MKRDEIYQFVSDRVLAALDKGVVPWRKPWVPGKTGFGFPMRMNSGTPYRGSNLIVLALVSMEMGYQSQWWGTYKFIAEKSGMVEVPNKNGKGTHWESPDGTPRGVRHGEKGTPVIYWNRVPVRAEDDEGKPTVRMVPMIRVTYAWNAEQADHLPAEYYADPTEVEGTFAEHREAEEISGAYLSREGSPTVIYDQADAANWRPWNDEIHLPPKEAFPVQSRYYSTVFHEETHSTGAKKRLHRKELEKYGKDMHSRPKEEMCAEMGAALLLAVAGIEDPEAFEQNVAYIDSWRKHISEDPQLVVNAAAAAMKAVDYILGIEYENGDKDELCTG